MKLIFLILILLYWPKWIESIILVQVYDEDTLNGYLQATPPEKIQSVYKFGDFYGYAYRGSHYEYSDWVTGFGQYGMMGYEEDQVTETFYCQDTCPWHLKAVTGDLKWSGCPFSKDQSGEGVMVYILDQYADNRHRQFGGRLEAGPAFIGSQIGQPHGTHVAGIVGSTSFGLAKNCRMKTVGVLSDTGTGSYSALLDGLQYVFNDAQKYRNRTVVNLSLGGPYSEIVNDAVNNLVQRAGIVVVVAAGNSAEDACRSTPASARLAITVGSFGPNYQFSSFSNYGRCVDINAPGEAILSTLPNQRQGYMTGTSMASPLVAARFALELGKDPVSPDIAWSRVFQTMQRDRLTRLPTRTPNRIVYEPPSRKCE